MDLAPEPVILPSHDPVREYTQAEERALARNLEAATHDVYEGKYAGEAPRLAFVEQLHRRLFSGVRGHGGRIRTPAFGSETLVFGPHRSEHRDRVPGCIEPLFTKLRHALASFDANPGANTYEPEALRLAVWAHAELIRIHPFEDGNGRTSRLLMNWVLVRLGLRPIQLEAPRQEYIACLNHYYVRGDIVPLVDLCLRLYNSE